MQLIICFLFSFHELQIYGNSHLAIKPEPFEEGATLHFQHMIVACMPIQDGIAKHLQIDTKVLIV